MRFVLIAATALFTFACGGAAQTIATPEIPKVTTEQLASWIGEKSVTVIDTNKVETFQENHIPGARNVRYDAVTAKDLPESKDARMAFYCTNEKCGASNKAATAALGLGYKNVFVYKPGIDGWKAAGQSVGKVEAPKTDG